MNNELEKKFETQANKMAAECVDFKTFHNHFFSQNSELLKDMSKEERGKFLKSPLYKHLLELETKLGLDQGYLTLEKGKPVEKHYSGMFVVRVPISLHQKLVVEANKEHTSLNGLCQAKLAIPLDKALKPA